jgi:AcrR family transcriptional regulator
MAKPPNPALARRILDITCEELAENPPERVNMRRIAERAGVSPTAIYYYYASKEELFETISFEAQDDIVRQIRAETAKAASSLEKISALVQVFLRWCRENPHRARLIMEKLPAREGLTDEKMRRYYAIADLAKEYLEGAVAEGSLERRDAELDISLAQAALWGICVQFASKRVYPRYWESIGPLVERFMELLLGRKGAFTWKE